MTIAISNDFLLAFSNVQKQHQRQVREFIERFREQPDAPGIHYEPVKSARGKDLYSVRINQAYRAIVFRPAGSSVCVLTWVDHHDEAYRWAERKKFVINPATGALQVVTVEAAEEARQVEASPAKGAPGLFDNIKDKHLLRLGVPDELIPLVRTIRTDAELEQAEDRFPQEAYEALYMLASGYSLEEVLRELEAREDEKPVDPDDFEAALRREDSQRRFYIVEEAKELAEILNAPLEQWRVFLHPKQRRLVRMKANGPVRVLGGAGTGKTVVAMHRAKYLAEEVFTAKEDRILFTTFTRNLATDIQENLRKICSVEALSRIDVINLDAWAGNFLRSQGYRVEPTFKAEDSEEWKAALDEAPAELRLPPSFYRTEWEQVIQEQNIRDAASYLKASRVGRGTPLSRRQKQKIWRVFQEYRAQLNERGKREFVDLLRDARELIETKEIPLPYRAAVVDEAQDMSSEAFRLIRAIVPEGPNDLFIVGDAHQRIYRYRVRLGQCGINIRGRGRKLRVNYRTTEETRRFAVAVLEGMEVDDLDGGPDDQKGYVSLTHGSPPVVRCLPDLAAEIEYLKDRIGEWKAEGFAEESICLVARTNKLLEVYEEELQRAGFRTYRIRRSVADQRVQPGLRLATMHRVKGLEFDYVCVVAANDGMIPLAHAIDGAEDAVAARLAETRERSLLYVALTRARRGAVITAHGTPSRFLQGAFRTG